MRRCADSRGVSCCIIQQHPAATLNPEVAHAAAGARAAAQAELDQRIAAGRGNGRLLRRQRRGERLRAEHCAHKEEALRRRRLVKARSRLGSSVVCDSLSGCLKCDQRAQYCVQNSLVIGRTLRVEVL